MSRLDDLPESLPGALPAAFWWLWAGALVNALASFVVVFLALFLKARGFSTERAGLVVSLFGVGQVVSGPVAGSIADRVGRRVTMLAALVGSAALTALLGTFTSPWAVALAVLGVGLVASAYRPASSALVADIVGPADRVRAYGHLYWAHNLGMGISAAVGGLLAARGFGLLFLADAGTTLLFALLVWRRVQEPPRPAGPGRPGSAPRGYAAVLSDRPFLVLLGLQVLFLVVFTQFLAAAPVDMGRHGLGPAEFGRVIAVNGVLIALLQPLAARWVGRFDPARVLAAGALLVGLGYGGYGLATTPWQYAGASAVWTLGEILTFPTATAVVAALSPADLRGRYQGLYGLTFGVAMVLSPTLGSLVLSRLGPGVLWSGCLAVALLVAAGHLAAGPARRRLAASRTA